MCRKVILLYAAVGVKSPVDYMLIHSHSPYESLSKSHAQSVLKVEQSNPPSPQVRQSITHQIVRLREMRNIRAAVIIIWCAIPAIPNVPNIGAYIGINASKHATTRTYVYVHAVTVVYIRMIQVHDIYEVHVCL